MSATPPPLPPSDGPPPVPPSEARAGPWGQPRGSSVPSFGRKGLQPGEAPPATPDPAASPPLDEARSVNCANCGGPLQLRGGRSVESLTCSYCGSLLDGHDFKLLERHDKLERPPSPLKLGYEGTLKGVRFTVIGMIESAVREDGRDYPWLDHLLFSPTHGYAYLTLEDGDWHFSRRVRDLPDPPTPEGLRKGSRVRFRGQNYRVAEVVNGRVRFVEGELTWIAKVGDKVRAVEAEAGSSTLAYELSHGEIEYALGEELPAGEVAAAFGFEASTASVEGRRAGRPGLGAALVKVGMFFLILSAVLTLAAWVHDGRTVLERTVNDPAQAVSLPFEVNDAARPLRLFLQAPYDNAWGGYAVEVRSAAGATVAAFGEEISYYSGHDGDGRWTEGSRTSKAVFRVPEPGAYVVEVERVAGEGQAPPSLGVRVNEGVLVARYFALLAVASLLTLLQGLRMIRRGG